MTNVKLKLMFFVLNALLTADFVHGRPYSEASNSTEYPTNFSNRTFDERDFHLPVDTNSDTLIVVDEHKEETVEETNRNSNTNLAAIMDAEQNRDEALSKKTMNGPMGVLQLARDDADDFHKQFNISTPNMDKIFDAETGREEDLTDHLFKSESEFIDNAPKFEFLVGGKLNASEGAMNKSGHVDNSLERVVNDSDVLRKVDYVELVEVGRPARIGENKSAYNLANITVHEVEDDVAPDTSFTDMQTLLVACFGTLLPLLGVLCVSLIVRCICRRWCKRCRAKASEISESESSDQKQDSHKQIKSTAGEESSASGAETADGDAGDNPTANGSIITMTLKNNHLIVETEERNDITKNGRETKMKYSPDNEGIFVVEVQQSTAYRPNNKPAQNSPPHDPQISTNQALIHRVPEDVEGLDKIAKKNYNTFPEESSEKSSFIPDKDKTLALSNTGLSISDLSMSSIGSHNVSYSYSSQMGYEHGPFGYPIYPGYEIPREPSIGDSIIHDNSTEPLISKTPTDPDKPVVTAAIFKQDSIIGNDALQGPGYCIEGSSDGPLLSDVQAREVSLQQLHDKMEKKLENGVAIPVAEKIESPKKALNRADSLPVRLEANSTPDVIVDKSVAMETIVEDMNSPINKNILKGKRASLPIIRTEMYESVKDAMIPTGSPKFEKFTNENSPCDNTGNSVTPLITITEENDVSGKTETVSS